MPTHRQLELFVAVADAGSMRRASDLLGISQPSISKQIKALERSLGGLLLVRTRGERAVLSPLGEELLEDARNSLAIQQRLTRRSDVAGRLPARIFVRTFLLDRIKSKLGELVAAGLPEDAGFIVSDDPAEALASDIEPGDLMAIFNAIRVPARSGSICHVLYDKFCGVYAAPPMASAIADGRLPLAEVAVLLPARSFRLTPWILGQMQALKINPGEQRFCSQFIDLIVPRVCAGEGIGMFMEDDAREAVAEGRLVKIARCPDPLHMVLLARPDVNPTVFEQVRRSFYKLAGPGSQTGL